MPYFDLTNIGKYKYYFSKAFQKSQQNFVGWSAGLGGLARKQLFCKLWSRVDWSGLQMCRFVCRLFIFLSFCNKLSAVLFIQRAPNLRFNSILHYILLNN